MRSLSKTRLLCAEKIFFAIVYICIFPLMMVSFTSCSSTGGVGDGPALSTLSTMPTAMELFATIEGRASNARYDLNEENTVDDCANGGSVRRILPSGSNPQTTGWTFSDCDATLTVFENGDGTQYSFVIDGSEMWSAYETPRLHGTIEVNFSISGDFLGLSVDCEIEFQMPEGAEYLDIDLAELEGQCVMEDSEGTQLTLTAEEWGDWFESVTSD